MRQLIYSVLLLLTCVVIVPLPGDAQSVSGNISSEAVRFDAAIASLHEYPNLRDHFVQTRGDLEREYADAIARGDRVDAAAASALIAHNTRNALLAAIEAETDPVELAELEAILTFSIIADGSNDDIELEREICAAGNIQQWAEDFASREIQFPEPADHCQGIMGQIAVRELLPSIYDLIAGDDFSGDDVWINIRHAAGQNLATYQHPNGQVRGLGCSLAYDAGFRYGFENPPDPLPQLTDEQVDQVPGRCFENSTASTYDGLVVGAIDGQSAWRGR